MPADSASVSTTAQGKAPPSGFGRGFVLDTWYFAALARDVGPGSMKRHELLGEPVLIGRTKAGRLFAMRVILYATTTRPGAGTGEVIFKFGIVETALEPFW